MQEIKYIHDEEHHNTVAPSIIVPLLIDIIQPKSVIDIGCGIGTFLNVFKKLGVENIYGVDGEWVNTELLSKYIDLKYFQSADLEKSLTINKKFDLVISLEVAEHLGESSAETMVQNLTNLGEVIVFSAAFPGQGGQNHVNEQWPGYWKNKFLRYSYEQHDLLRSILWDEINIPTWYKQNMFLYVKSGTNNHIIEKFLSLKSDKIINYIHPEYYYPLLQRNEILEKVADQYYTLKKGKESFLFYIKLIANFFFRKLSLYRK